MARWRQSKWGDEVSLEYGRGIRDYTQKQQKYRVYGSNGPIGWTNVALSRRPGVILGRKGAYRGVFYSKEPFYVIDTAYYVVAKSDLDMRWLYYAIIYYKLGEIDDGSPIPSTTRAAVYVRDVEIPPAVEQRRIASILGALDDKIDLNRRMNETLEAMAAIMFDDAERSTGWSQRPLGSFVEIFDGPHATPKLLGHGPIFLGISNLASGVLDLSATSHVSGEDFARWTRRVEPKAGDLVFSYETRLGQAALIPSHIKCCLGRRMGLLRVKAPWLSPLLLLRAYLAPAFQETIRQRTIHGSTVDRIPLKDMGSFPICLPDPDQAQGLAPSLATLRDKLNANERETEILAGLRDLLLPKLMSGELRVRDAERVVEAAL